MMIFSKRAVVIKIAIKEFGNILICAKRFVEANRGINIISRAPSSPIRFLFLKNNKKKTKVNIFIQRQFIFSKDYLLVVSFPNKEGLPVSLLLPTESSKLIKFLFLGFIDSVVGL